MATSTGNGVPLAFDAKVTLAYFTRFCGIGSPTQLRHVSVSCRSSDDSVIEGWGADNRYQKKGGRLGSEL
jgi:hypothetical protein